MTPENAYENTYEGYHQFRNEDGEPYGSFEVVYLTNDSTAYNYWDRECEPGWYWAAGFPGCLYDGDPCGPFDTSLDAYNDAMGDNQ
jgi:hypothetical protein